MRNPSPPSRRLLATLPAFALCLGLAAQDPESSGQEHDGAPKAAEPKPEPVVALRVGTVHTVSGAVIEDGVILIRGTRIAAVGKRSDVDIPAEATTLDYAKAHAYPGLVDAWSDAFLDNATRADGSLDAGSALQSDLRTRGDREDELIQQGITTAYIGTRGPAQWRGQGVIVRPIAGGYEILTGKEHAALQLRLTNGPGASHPLQRQQQAQGLFAAFDGLADYKKQFDEHKKALEKYQKDFADYLAHFEKKKDKDKEPASGAAPSGAPSAPASPQGPRGGQLPPGTGETPPGGRRGGRRGGNGGGGGDGGNGGGGGMAEWLLDAIEAAQDPKPTPAPAPAQGQDPKPANGAPAAPGAAPAAPAQDKPPERPKYPKEPAHDPVKDALLLVLDGKLPLRIEAHRADEIRSALALAAEKKVPVTVLEQPFAAAICASELAKAGASCVLTEVWPVTLPKPYEAFDMTAVPAALQAQGVPFAIASGSGRRANALPMMAACAIGRGLDEAAALRAITLSAAEILGVQSDTGSLTQGKLGDVLVCDRPLFQSDCRVLAVMSAGKTQFEAK